jgi:hypothetical protein
MTDVSAMIEQGSVDASARNPRIDGRLHDPRTWARREEVAELVVSAVDLARPSQAGTPG